MSITFGSDEVLLLIEKNIIHDENAQWYAELYEIVTNQCKRILYRDYRFHSILTESDMDDVAQIVNLKISQHLVDFYYRSKTATEAQRNAWFKTVVKHTAEDFIRKEKRIRIESIDPSRALRGFPSSSTDNPQAIAEVHSEIMVAVQRVCQLPASAQNIMAFLIGKISVAFASGRTSVSAKEMIRQLKGKTLFDAFDSLKQLLCEFWEDDIPDCIFDGLVAKLNMPAGKGLVGDQVFDMSAKQISNAIEWFRRKMSEDSGLDDNDQSV